MVVLASLLGIELYVRNYDGWGAWASAPLLLVPAIVSLPIVMKLSAWLYYSAFLIYVVAWGTPVVEGGATFSEGRLLGWQAFVAALNPLLRWDAGDGLVRALLPVTSALTNLLFIGLLVRLVPRAARPRPIAVGALLAATLVNGHWIWFAYETTERLRLGYFLWLGAFLCLAGSAALPPRGASRQPETGAA